VDFSTYTVQYTCFMPLCATLKYVQYKKKYYMKLIRRIHMFLGLLDPDPDPLVRGTDPDSYHQAKIVRKTLIPIVL
jgi:hypothetical protein